MRPEWPTIYARHNMSIGENGVDWLYENDYIAIHYGDKLISASENEWKEEGNSTAGNKLKWFRKWSESGALVGADYSSRNSTYKGGMVVGTIEPGTPVSFLVFVDDEFEGKIDVPPDTREENVLTVAEEQAPELLEIFEEVTNTDDGIRIYKGLKLTDTNWVWYRDYPVLLAVQLRQGSVSGWNKGETQLRAIRKGVSDLREILGDDPTYTEMAQLLAPGQLEVLCNEFLRDQNDQYLQNLPVGRSLQDVDIVARTSPNGERVLAQVTHARDTTDIQSKAADLIRYGQREMGNTKLLFFGPEYNENDLAGYEIDEYISNERVYRYMVENKSDLLDEMMTVPPAEETEEPLS